MPTAGEVVLALNGRDKGSCFLVLGSENGRVLIADGNRRKLERPKQKNPRHLQSTGHSIPLDSVTGNRRLKSLLSVIHPVEAARLTVNE